MNEHDVDAEHQRWFRQAVLPLEGRLRQHALRLHHGNRADADDLVHDALLKIMTMPGWEQISDPLPFAVRTLRNLAIDRLRRSKIVAFDALTDLGSRHLADAAPGPEQTANGREELERLAQAIAQLPDQCREVFVLRKIHDMSPRDIANRLGIALSTVEKHLAKGLRLCTERLANAATDTSGIERTRTWQETVLRHVRR